MDFAAPLDNGSIPKKSSNFRESWRTKRAVRHVFQMTTNVSQDGGVVSHKKERAGFSVFRSSEQYAHFFAEILSI